MAVKKLSCFVKVMILNSAGLAILLAGISLLGFPCNAATATGAGCAGWSATGTGRIALATGHTDMTDQQLQALAERSVKIACRAFHHYYVSKPDADFSIAAGRLAPVIFQVLLAEEMIRDK